MRLSEEQKDIIRLVGAGLLVASAIVCPNIAQLLKYLEPDNSKKRYIYKQSLIRLKKKGVLQLFGEEIKLTKKGKLLLKYIDIESFNINPEGEWDGRWHLICYDVPERYKTERDYFRLKLLDLGFVIIQDSLWVYPFNCKEEMAVIADYFGIGKYVAYLDTDYLPNQKSLINKFNLSPK